MRDELEFEIVLDDVLREIANPEPEIGLRQRVILRLELAANSAMQKTAAGVFESRQAQEGLFRSIWSGLLELISPRELPPLVLESRPVAVVDRMVVGRSYRATVWAVLAHFFAILMVGYAATTRIHIAAPVPLRSTALSDPLQSLPKDRSMGGGGGQRGPTPVTKGTPPQFADEQIVPPKAPPLEAPKIHIEPTIEVQPDVKMASTVPQIGVPNSPLVGLSVGVGTGTGIGSGNGPGMGPGWGGNMGGGPRMVGGGVSAPVVVYSVEPEFSEEARRAKFSGNVLVSLWVDEKGIPSHVHVVHSVGMGLDEKAVAAVKQYRFKPAMENGKPVMVEMYIDVTFTIL